MDFKERVHARISKLEDRRVLMQKYLQDRVDDQDYHGVMDAAADLREIIQDLNSVKEIWRLYNEQQVHG